MFLWSDFRNRPRRLVHGHVEKFIEFWLFYTQTVTNFLSYTVAIGRLYFDIEVFSSIRTKWRSSEIHDRLQPLYRNVYFAVKIYSNRFQQISCYFSWEWFFIIRYEILYFAWFSSNLTTVYFAQIVYVHFMLLDICVACMRMLIYNYYLCKMVKI